MPYKTSLYAGVRTLQRTVSTNVWKCGSQRPHIRYVGLYVFLSRLLAIYSYLITLLGFTFPLPPLVVFSLFVGMSAECMHRGANNSKKSLSQFSSRFFSPKSPKSQKSKKESLKNPKNLRKISKNISEITKIFRKI